MSHTCASCDEPTDKRCAGCSKVWYCSRSCQEALWYSHLFDCKPKDKITTADHLYLACLRDIIPRHEQTRNDYGFTRAGGSNQSYLLGLYIGLMIYRQVKARTVHKWVLQGTLAQEIVTEFEKPLTNLTQGGYYAWFLRNQWVLDGNVEASRIQMENDGRSIFTAGWLYSGGSSTFTSDQIREICSTWPGPKEDCMLFSGLMLNGARPGPSMARLWINFGFCTCTEEGEVQLGQLYTRLLHSCTSQEFLAAYESSQMIDLFRLKGLDSELSLGPYEDFEQHLSTSPHINFSVWNLKQHILSEQDNTLIIPSVNVDYGFVNCRTEDERRDLKAVYETYFKNRSSNAPALHQACIQGNLFNFISSFIRLTNKKKFRRLLKNIYPLPEQ